MQAAIVSNPGTVSVESLPDPAPGSNDLVIAPRAVGICGTDLHIVDGHFPPAPYPIVPGHEFAGEIVAVGRDVADFQVGERVTVDPSLFCGRCIYCRRQRGNLCQQWGAIGDTVDGAFAEYVVVPSGNAYAIPEDMSWSAAALVEPLACVVHGLRRLALPAGAELLVVGAGTIGLLILQAARRSGAAIVSVIDSDPRRRDLARLLGADQVSASIGEALEGRGIGYEYAVEATGVPAVGEAALTGLCRGGTLLIFGVAPAEARLPLSQFRVYNDEITVLGSMAVLNTFEPALRLMCSGAIACDAMVTKTYALSNFATAIEAVRSREGLKIQVAPGADASNESAA